MTPNQQGALLMIGSMASFTLNDVILKIIAEDIPLYQIVFLRGLLTTALLATLAFMMGALQFRMPHGDRLKIFWRTVLEIASVVTFLTALINMQIANAVAILSALPLAVTLGAAVLFRERVGWRRITAICVGALGVILIVQPGAEGFNIYSVLVLMTVLIVAGRDLLTRGFSDQVPLISVAVLTAGSVCIFGGIMSLTEPWAPLSARNIALIALASLSIIGGYVCALKVMRVGDVSVTSPFRYTSLVFALIAGYFVFREFPNALALCGAAIVVATGVFTLVRENQVRHG